ncbi:class I SAM-dependent methyltransferase [Methylobacterium sp. AMS5]|uniref:class I SAM-dependent methyltransferase n=1 Tax=Methylobacterium sp. AMS5 TaxID=925818 RepID=UPI000A667468|nr:class I SAM-dependent methyltransferase [Methylobacterium sp. AMS5]
MLRARDLEQHDGPHLGMTLLKRTLHNHPQIKRALKSVAKSAGLFRDSPANDFYRDLAEVKTRGDDAFSKLFYGYDGDHLINKWNHFLPIYSRLFAPFRDGRPDGRPLRFLEIGVYEGGSLDLWRRFFGPSAILYGIDVDPRCAVFDGHAAQVRIGSQADPAFLRSVVEEMGGVDVVLDDGSHVASHQRVSFETLFPLLAQDGLYVAEDLHTSYWRDYEGGYRRRGTFLEMTKAFIDDMHAWYHDRGAQEIGRSIGAIHVYDSIVAFEKGGGERPFHTTIGTPQRPIDRVR